ncbi:MAG TPA: glycosyltransferase [bacterium]|nr:glycosyltransferase [bacterium]
MKKKILYIVGGLCQGGGERQLCELISHLDRRLYDPVLLIYTNERKIFYKEIFESCPNVIACGATDHSDLTGAALAFKWTTKTILDERPDIVHSFMHFGNFFARAASLISPKTPVITTIFGNFDLVHSPLFRKAELILGGRNTFVTVDLPESKKQLARTGRVRPEKIIFIPTALDASRFESLREKTAAKNKLGLPEESFVVSCVARYSPVKNQLCTLRAARELKRLGRHESFRFIFAGDTGDTTYHNTLTSFVMEEHIEDIVNIGPVVEDVGAIFAASDFSVLSSHSEGIPNVLLESFACGAPVVISSTANSAGLVESGKTGFVFKDDDHLELAEKLLTCANLGDAERRNMSDECKRKVVNEFSWSEIIKKYQELYEIALSGR